jgi:hypothetical protein
MKDQCTNCHDCFSCIFCIDCTNCGICTNCYDCHGCIGLVNANSIFNFNIYNSSFYDYYKLKNDIIKEYKEKTGIKRNIINHMATDEKFIKCRIYEGDPKGIFIPEMLLRIKSFDKVKGPKHNF